MSPFVLKIRIPLLKGSAIALDFQEGTVRGRVDPVTPNNAHYLSPLNSCTFYLMHT